MEISEREAAMKLLHILGVRNGERTLEEIEEMVARVRRRRVTLNILRRKIEKRADVAERVARESDGEDVAD